MKGLIHILRRLWQRTAERGRRARFARAVTHVHGPRVLDAALQDVIAIVLVRNGAYYLDAFLAHYRAMGVRHFAFIDNGSTDDTLARIAAQPDTVIDQCTLPLAKYGDLIRAYPARTYATDRWCLYVDIDEMLDFEGRGLHGIHALTSYMAAQGHTALVAQTLEMFPKGPLAASAHLSFDQALDSFVYFDISAVDRYDYHAGQIPFAPLLAENKVTNPQIKICFGGVCGKAFGEACCLTKHPLVFNSADVPPAPHPDVSVCVTCSDVTAVIKRYKFANKPLLVQDAAHGADTAQAKVTGSSAELSLFSLNARRWNRVELLYRAGFLNASSAYTAHIENLTQQTPPGRTTLL